MATQSTLTLLDSPELGADPLASRIGHAFQSARLHYRGVDQDDADFLFKLKADPAVDLNSSARWPRPITRDEAAEYCKALKKSLISAIIELDPSKEQPEQRVPIGTVSLSACYGPEISQCRTAALAINIASEYQGRGYGTEAVRWILDWAFEMAGLHRVRFGCFGYNTRAIRMYESVGFERAGVEKEALWLGGRYWDLIMYGMLDREWVSINEERNTDKTKSKTYEEDHKERG